MPLLSPHLNSQDIHLQGAVKSCSGSISTSNPYANSPITLYSFKVEIVLTRIALHCTAVQTIKYLVPVNFVQTTSNWKSENTGSWDIDKGGFYRMLD